MTELSTKTNDGNLTGRRVFAVRVSTDTPDKLAEIAEAHGFYYMAKDRTRRGSAGALMDAIAKGEIELSSSRGEGA